jgi:hypothetical protein
MRHGSGVIMEKIVAQNGGFENTLRRTKSLMRHDYAPYDCFR